jgi:hypothetical protein
MPQPRCTLALACFLLLPVVSNSSAQTPAPITAPQVQTAPVQAPIQEQLQANAGGETVPDIEAKCGFSLTETNAKKIRKANLCVTKAIRVRQERLRLEYILEDTTRAETAATQSAATLAQSADFVESLAHSQNPAPAGAGGGGEASPTAATPIQNFVGGSLSGTPSTCLVSNAISNPAYIRVHRDILTPKTSADDFGYRLGHRFIVYQVTIENGNKDYQFMLQDVSIDFSRQFGAAPGTYRYSASGQDLMLLRGVPEKGEDLDPRNKVLHLLQGIGSVAGAVSGLTSFADVMGSSVAVFNGSFLQGYSTMAPDHISTQLNRLSDSAFTANTIIDQQRAKTIAMFIPVDEVLSEADQKQFRKDPYAFIGFGTGFANGLLNQADICVDGTFIQKVTVATPVLTSLAFHAGSSTTKNTDAVLDLAGANLVGGDTMLVVSGTVPATWPVTANADGKTGTAQVHLPSDFDQAKTTFTLQSKSNPALNSGAGVLLQAAKPAPVVAPVAPPAGIVKPTLTAATLEKTPAPAADSDATLDVTGTNLVDGDTTVEISGAAPTSASLTVNTAGTAGKATVHLPKDYVSGTTTATLKSKSTPAMMSAAVKLQVAP